MNQSRQVESVIPNSAAIILAGGNSSRLGREKAFLPWQGSTFIETLVTNLKGICQEVLLVTTPQHDLTFLPARVVYDILPDKNSLGGLYAGLAQSNQPVNFVCACDMPLLLPELVRNLINKLEEFDAVVPHAHDRLQPLCAVYTKACLPFIEQQLQRNKLRMTAWLTQARVRIVPEAEVCGIDPALQSFFNVNTEEDYQKLLEASHHLL